MGIERITELTSPPVVGRFYMVPTVNGTWMGVQRWWPVMGDLHEDTKFFSVREQHYHLDRRFIAERYVSHAVSRVLAEFAPLGLKLSAVEWKRRMCLRATMQFPVHKTQVREMQAALAGAKCRKAALGGWICPHRGYDLSSIKADDGVILCPLHGLQINAETGIAAQVPS